MRYVQASAIVENMLLDAKFQELSAKERQRILERLLNEIRETLYYLFSCN